MFDRIANALLEYGQLEQAVELLENALLQKQIALLKPKLIVLLGKAAMQAVLGEDGTLSSMRGKTLSYRDGATEIPLLVTYHPAYLLRNLPDKARAWEDLCRARSLMRQLRTVV